MYYDNETNKKKERKNIDWKNIKETFLALNLISFEYTFLLKVVWSTVFLHFVWEKISLIFCCLLWQKVKYRWCYLYSDFNYTVKFYIVTSCLRSIHFYFIFLIESVSFLINMITNFLFCCFWKRKTFPQNNIQLHYVLNLL